MSIESTLAFPPLALPPDEPLDAEEIKSCCASVYEHPAVRWLLGGELHPGGQATTRRALKLLRLGAGDRLLDVASGGGDSALLAVREVGCRAIGVEYGEGAVLGATAASEAEGLAARAGFVRGDAEALPLPDQSFDAALCECSLCTFPDKAGAVAEIRRVLRPGGRLAVADVVVDPERLPRALLAPMAAIACIGSALTGEGYMGLLEEAGFEIVATESRAGDAARFAERIEDRLRGARVLGLDHPGAFPIGITDAVELVGLARRAIEDGALSYAILAAVRR